MSAETVKAAFMTDRKKSIEKKFIKIKQGKWVMMLYPNCSLYIFIHLWFHSFYIGFFFKDLKRKWTY